MAVMFKGHTGRPCCIGAINITDGDKKIFFRQENLSGGEFFYFFFLPISDFISK